ncbi:ACT domain-containing protein [Hoyosella sp. YIM 151337]|uniref:ACT domain-containing protein n=1 Tax=Hoyosella sp. YIM 151337 TaxID=2992742 RepID=UPI00223612D8|nr:ACT domain-containing protein [Hoyosella sp. YIM 151337]MCW4354340.1 ACT domain-containing protein [Hoyosella sp. YIM 151337]
MATDLTILVDDHPGELAHVGEVLGTGGVNIEGFCAVQSGGGRSEIHVLVADPEAAFSALKAGCIEVTSEQEVVVVRMEDKPGMLGEVARKLGSAKVNITLAYLATNNRLVIAADNLADAKAAIT